MTASTATAAPPVGLELLLGHFDNTLGQGRKLKTPRRLVHATAALMLGLGVWAAFASVDLVVHTQGRIVPSAKQQLVQHLEGGIVSKVYVHEGDSVKAGDPLVAVSDLAASSSRGEKQARLGGLRSEEHTSELQSH